ncbi:mating-type switching protein swi10, partial [Nadsonia fulvescens var. elongata DSM 6958]
SPSPMSSTELNLNVSSHSSQAQTIQSGPPPVINRAIVPSTHNTILVSKRQKGNPVLLHIRGTAWEYSDIVPDYITGLTSCVLFLSLKYHRIHPEYIHNRMSKLGNLFTLRTLLVVIDIENHPEPIKELTKVCVIRGYTLVLAWSASEAGDYISKFKVLENIAPVGIQGFMKEDYSIRITEVLNSVRGINKNDAISLISTFGSLKEAILDAGDSVETIGGWGETKARRFKVAVTEPFIYNKKY